MLNKIQRENLQKIFPSIRFNESLKNHCTFRIGGPADAFIEIQNIDVKTTKRLIKLFKFLNKSKIPYLILGGGSNVLFHDKGFSGVVIKITSNKIEFNNFKTAKSQGVVEADAGANLQFLITKAKEKGYQNLFQFTGIPGTFGGAVRGNAGANGIEIKDVLISAKVLNTKTGAIKTFTNKQLKFTYRNSYIKKNPNFIVLSAKLSLKKFSKKELEEKKELFAKIATYRTETQPWGLSAGSFFKNPTPSHSPVKHLSTSNHIHPTKCPTSSNHPTLTPDQFKAGYLIDQCGLKGACIGGAIISEKHANFFQNLNDPKHPATQKDILSLVAKAQKAVFKKFKIRLEPEVQIVPQKPKHSRKTRK